MMHATKTVAADALSGVSLDRLLPDATRTGTKSVVANSCTSDWHEVRPGDVFVALSERFGHEEDGHEYVLQAVDRGAIAIICEEPVPVFDVPTFVVADSRDAYGKLCQALSGMPHLNIPVIAVTGTHGKSTVIALLDSIFAVGGKHCGMISGIGCYDGMSHSAGVDVSSAPELASRLERMVAAGCTHALVEVSSEAIAQATFAGLAFDAVCITNVSDAHLDLHNTVVSYRNLKRRILESLDPAGVAVFNADDPISSKWLMHVDGPVLTFGTKDQAEVCGCEVKQHSNEQVFMISAGNQSVAVRTAMVGQHHVSNCLAAAALALSYGIDLQTIAAGIEAVEKLPGRMERVDCGQGFPVYVDAADTAESLRASLRTARQLSTRRVVCVLGDPGPATYSEQIAVAHVVGRLADVAIVARDFPEEETAIDDSERRACVEVVADRAEAIACAVALAKPGDVVVIAGSRWEPQKAYGSFIVEQKEGDAALTRQLLGPYPILIGLLTIAMFALHGGLYLHLKTEGGTQRLFYRWIWHAWGLYLVLWNLATMYTLVKIPRATDNFSHAPWAIGVVILNVLAMSNIPRCIYFKQIGQAFISSSVGIACQVTLVGVALFPNLVTASNDPVNSLTIYNAASSQKTLMIMLIIALIGMPAVISYTTVVYWTFRGKVTEDVYGH